MKAAVIAALRFWASIAGLPPEVVASIFALGMVLGVFPVYGLPTLFCAPAALVFRLNLPAIQVVNQLCSPLQLLLLVPLGRAGARVPFLCAGGLGGSTHWNLPDAARNAITGWFCFCVPAGLALYAILAVGLRHRHRRLNLLESPV